MGGTVSEPDWKTELRSELETAASDIERGNGIQGGVDYARQGLEYAVFEAVDAAYQRGLQAGRSQAGYKTSRKKKENDSWPTVIAGAAGPTPVSITEPTDGSEAGL